jgi:hypothetical protein
MGLNLRRTMMMQESISNALYQGVQKEELSIHRQTALDPSFPNHIAYGSVHCRLRMLASSFTRLSA